jgi:predicted transcriptional regulator
MWLDVTPYMNATPHRLMDSTSLAKTFNLFRTMGLRHLILTDEHNSLTGIVTRKDLYNILPHHTKRDFVKPVTNEYQPME